MDPLIIFFQISWGPFQFLLVGIKVRQEQECHCHSGWLCSLTVINVSSRHHVPSRHQYCRSIFYSILTNLSNVKWQNNKFNQSITSPEGSRRFGLLLQAWVGSVDISLYRSNSVYNICIHQKKLRMHPPLQRWYETVSDTVDLRPAVSSTVVNLFTIRTACL